MVKKGRQKKKNKSDEQMCKKHEDLEIFLRAKK